MLQPTGQQPGGVQQPSGWTLGAAGWVPTGGESGGAQLGGAPIGVALLGGAHLGGVQLAGAQMGDAQLGVMPVRPAEGVRPEEAGATETEVGALLVAATPSAATDLKPSAATDSTPSTATDSTPAGWKVVGGARMDADGSEPLRLTPTGLAPAGSTPSALTPTMDTEALTGAAPAGATASGIKPSDVMLTDAAQSGTTPTGAAPSRLTPSGWTAVGYKPTTDSTTSGVTPSGVTPSGVTPSGGEPCFFTDWGPPRWAVACVCCVARRSGMGASARTCLCVRVWRWGRQCCIEGCCGARRAADRLATVECCAVRVVSNSSALRVQKQGTAGAIEHRHLAHYTIYSAGTRTLCTSYSTFNRNCSGSRLSPRPLCSWPYAWRQSGPTAGRRGQLPDSTTRRAERAPRRVRPRPTVLGTDATSEARPATMLRLDGTGQATQGIMSVSAERIRERHSLLCSSVPREDGRGTGLRTYLRTK